METTLTIKCDIKDAQAVLYAAKKVIEHAEGARDQDRLDRINIPEVVCPRCNWSGMVKDLIVGREINCPKCRGSINLDKKGV